MHREKFRARVSIPRGAEQPMRCQSGAKPQRRSRVHRPKKVPACRRRNNHPQAQKSQTKCASPVSCLGLHSLSKELCVRNVLQLLFGSKPGNEPNISVAGYELSLAKIASNPTIPQLSILSI